MNGWELAGSLAASIAVFASAGLVLYLRATEDGSLTDESTFPRRAEPSSAERLARDVAVNVVANLIAAAIIYILAATVGILPRSPYLLMVAGMVVTVGAGVCLAAVGVVARARARIYFLATSLAALGLPLLSFPMLGDRLVPNEVLRWVAPFSGISAIYVGLSVILRVRRE